MSRRTLTILLLIGTILPLACGEEPDSEFPTVAIVAPLDGHVVDGEVLIQVEADDNEGVVSVEIAVDDEVLVTLEAPPWEQLWSTEDWADGEAHSLQAAATDEAGNTRLSDYVTVTVAVP